MLNFEFKADAFEEDLEFSILINVDNKVRIVPDGVKYRLTFNYERLQHNLIYIPPSNKFDLAISAIQESFNYSSQIFIKKVNSSEAFELIKNYED